MIIAIPTNNAGAFNEVPKRSQNAAYCKYVSDAGYDPILVPMEADPVRIAELADGLLLAGGIDIDPIHYGFSNIASYNVDPEKDASERALFHAFRDFDKPVFGICRGFQLIFRELLFAHDEHDEYEMYFDYTENISHHAQTSGLNVPRRFPSHQINANVERLFGANPADLPNGNPYMMIPVNSMHHQAVICNFAQATIDLAPDMINMPGFNKKEPMMTNIMDVELLGWSMRGVNQPTKGAGTNLKPDYENYWTIVEAARIHNWGGPIMAVQWHPEELGDIRIIRNFFSPPEEVVITA